MILDFGFIVAVGFGLWIISILSYFAGERAGRVIGYKEGRRAGYEAGIHEGFDAGYDKGFRHGHSVGRTGVRTDYD